MNILISWITLSIIIILAAFILPGVEVTNIFTALVTAFVLGLLNAFLKPILIFLTLPINILTLGLFTLVINGAIVLFAAALVPGLSINSIWWAILLSIIISLSTSLVSSSQNK